MMAGELGAGWRAADRQKKACAGGVTLAKLAHVSQHTPDGRLNQARRRGPPPALNPPTFNPHSPALVKAAAHHTQAAHRTHQRRRYSGYSSIITPQMLGLRVSSAGPLSGSKKGRPQQLRSVATPVGGRGPLPTSTPGGSRWVAGHELALVWVGDPPHPIAAAGGLVRWPDALMRRNCYYHTSQQQREPASKHPAACRPL
jgi:hypothetical protein